MGGPAGGVAGRLGGVPLPKLLYQLPDGRQFYIQADFGAFERQVNERAPVPASGGASPDAISGHQLGWFKEYGVLRTIMPPPRRSTSTTSPGA